MKRLLITFVLIFSFLSLKAADITSISNAFKEGNATTLATSMDSEIDLSLSGVNEKYTGADAIELLDAFFKSNKPSGFTVLHHADKNETGFVVGKLPSESKEYRVNITYRAEGDKAIIQSIRIE
jgi:hypothetical protein